MRIPISWLNELLSKPLTAEQIRETLTHVGLEVESLEYRAPGLETVVVGQIAKIDPHPNADKLRVCQTDVGDSALVQIVTGAPNVKAGDKIPVARVGSLLPGGKSIDEAKLRGVDSFGMYCSLTELGLPSAGAEDGVLILAPETPIGSPIAAVMQLGELVLDIAVTANRGDALSVMGVARELVVAHPHLSLKPPAANSRPELALDASPVKLGPVDQERAPLYMGLNLTGVTVGPSPTWAVKRLEAAGLRAINNVVDATNYIMLLTGQPLHAFDTAKIRGAELRVRTARDGETLTTLDGVVRQLLASDLVIADDERALVVAGIMGGRDAEVDAQTRDLFLEAAYFAPEAVRKTSRRLGLSTESSFRFERGIDPTGVGHALDLLRDLITEWAGGEVVGPTWQRRKSNWPFAQPFEFHLDAIERLLGVSVPNQEVERILLALGFSLARHTDGVFELNSYEVGAPGWRFHDTRCEADLVEEVARHFGYDRIPTVLPPVVEKPKQPALVALETRARGIGVGLGLAEVMTKSLTTVEAEGLAGVGGLASTTHIALANPLKDMAVLRTSLLPSLLEVLRYNRYQGQSRLGIFEIGRTYELVEDIPVETLWLGGAIMASLWQGLWLAEQTPAPLAADFSYAKGMVESFFDRLEVSDAPVFVRGAAHPGLHPGRTAEIHVAGRLVGVVGELHPQIAAHYDLPAGQPSCAWLLNMSAIAALEPRQTRFQAFSRLPATLRDLAVVVPEAVNAGDALAVIREAGGDLLERVAMFDRFSGGALAPGTVSLGFSLVYRAEDRTLTAADVEPTHQRIVERLAERFGAELRG